jgi:hypothetical protein
VEALGLGAPEVSQGNMRILKVARGTAEESRRAAGLELHAHVVGLEGIDRERARMSAAQSDSAKLMAFGIAGTVVPGEPVPFQVDLDSDAPRRHDRVSGMTGIGAFPVPKVFDAAIEWRRRNEGPVDHAPMLRARARRLKRRVRQRACWRRKRRGPLTASGRPVSSRP